MQVFLGVLYHFIGGVASGSFYLPYNKVRQWSWESYWMVGGIFSWLFVPWIAVELTVPGYQQILHDTSWQTLCWTYLMGLLWGIGGLTFGLTMRYLGLSLGMSVVLGFCSAFGALIPPLYRDIAGGDGETFVSMLHSVKGGMVLLGILVCLLGIGVCGQAGRWKERELSVEKQKETVREFNLPLGLMVATVSGILSACFNFGIEAGQSMAHLAVVRGTNALFQNNVVFLVILWGGLTTNLLWCIFLNIRNKTYADYADGKAPLVNNYLFSALAGTVWFLQFFFYGMGASKLSNGASSWILHMAFIILVANLWGFLLKEWSGVSTKTVRLLSAGTATILISVVLVGLGNASAQ
ncbi:MAG: L-rhamnose/proton symporter RhaT [Rudaea sp.]|uniref:L-rhamnose/proton symporter RhaT n=1 Tax=Rudaea sp. TaxID=2136325 RepID=UPI0039E67624